MQHFDWIVIGAGITGASLGYELARQGLRVLVLDRQATPTSATRYSYGGIAHWAGNTPITQQICAESLSIHRHLSDELDADTQFRAIDLLLTIPHDADLAAIVASYAGFSQVPELLMPSQARSIEPLLNPDAIAAALRLPHAHIDAQQTATAYQTAMHRQGGTLQIATVQQIQGNQVMTSAGDFSGETIAVCTGGATRQLLQSIGRPVPQYFSHAESIETAPTAVQLRTIVMPAVTQRFALEAQTSTAAIDDIWNQPQQEIAPPILDAGAVQFSDGHVRMGQISRTWSDLNIPIDAKASEALIRQQVGQILPAIAALPGQWCRCTVGFSRDHRPTVGRLPDCPEIFLFSGFSNPMALVPSIARRVAAAAVGDADPLLATFSPERF
jgi:glycine/D-amino acid oxidase-like deaminating enzyme